MAFEFIDARFELEQPLVQLIEPLLGRAASVFSRRITIQARIPVAARQRSRKRGGDQKGIGASSIEHQIGPSLVRAP